MSQDQPTGTITPYQGYALIVATIIAVEVLSFPRTLAKEAGPDGIWVLIIAGVISAFFLYLITRLGEKFPGKNIAQFAPQILGPKGSSWIGKILSFPLILAVGTAWIGVSAMVVRSFGEVMVGAVLLKTPLEFVMVSLCAAAAIVCSNRPEILARYAEFLLPFLYAPAILLFIAMLQKGEMENLLPLFQVNWNQLFNGLVKSVFAFSGIKIPLIFMAFYQQPQRAMHSHLTAIGVVIIGYLGTFISSLAVFGSDEIVHLLWPTLELIKEVRIPGGIFERVESAVIVVWMIAVFATITGILGAAVQLVLASLRLHERYRKWLAWMGATVIYVVGLLPSTVENLFLWAERLGLFSMLVSIVLPLLLLGVMRVRGMKGRNYDEQSST